MFKLKIEMPVLNEYSKRQYNADLYCECCGRGIANRKTSQVVVTKRIAGEPRGQLNFQTIAEYADLGSDPVEWGSFIGSHCAKQIPKEYRISFSKCMKEWAKSENY